MINRVAQFFKNFGIGIYVQLSREIGIVIINLLLNKYHYSISIGNMFVRPSIIFLPHS